MISQMSFYVKDKIMEKVLISDISMICQFKGSRSVTENLDL